MIRTLSQRRSEVVSLLDSHGHGHGHGHSEGHRISFLFSCQPTECVLSSTIQPGVIHIVTVTVTVRSRGIYFSNASWRKMNNQSHRDCGAWAHVYPVPYIPCPWPWPICLPCILRLCMMSSTCICTALSLFVYSYFWNSLFTSPTSSFVFNTLLIHSVWHIPWPVSLVWQKNRDRDSGPCLQCDTNTVTVTLVRVVSVIKTLWQWLWSVSSVWQIPWPWLWSVSLTNHHFNSYVHSATLRSEIVFCEIAFFDSEPVTVFRSNDWFDWE